MRTLIALCILGAAELPALLHGKLVWDTLEIETHAKVGQTTVEVSYPFHIEDQDTTILSVKPSCGCTAATLEKTSYKVGETGQIDVVFDPTNRSGLQHKTIRVTTDDPDNKAALLSLKVEIDQLLTVEPRFVFWLRNDPDPQPQQVHISLNPDYRVHLRSVECDSDSVTTKIKGISPGEYTLYVTPLLDDNHQFKFERAIIEVSVLLNGKPYPTKTKIHVFLK